MNNVNSLMLVKPLLNYSYGTCEYKGAFFIALI